MDTKKILAYIVTPDELQEIDIVLTAMSSNGPLKLKRTYNQPAPTEYCEPGKKYMRFWRVMSPWHTHYGSDIGLMWLKEKGYIKHGN